MKGKELRTKLHFIAQEFFRYSLATYLLLLLAEAVKPGMVSFFFNMNILLAVVVVCGIGMILTQDKKFLLLPTNKRKKSLDITLSILFALGGGFFVSAYALNFGLVSFLIGLIASFIILIISFLVLNESK